MDLVCEVMRKYKEKLLMQIEREMYAGYISRLSSSQKWLRRLIGETKNIVFKSVGELSKSRVRRR